MLLIYAFEKLFCKYRMMKNPLLLFILLLFTVELQAQTAALECLTVREQDGAVTLRFSGPTGTSAYKIYRSDQLNGIYTLIHTTTNGSFSIYIDAEVNASTQSYSYYVEAIKNGSSTGESNKMRTILLTVNNLQNGLARLSWNDDGGSSNNSYQIFRKSLSGLLVFHDSSPTTTYIDTIRACSADYFYQIRVMSNGCESISNIRGGSFSDITKPGYVIPKNASIDTASGEIVLSWLLPPSQDADIRKYQIWLINSDGGSTQFPLAEIYGYNSLSVRLNYDLVCDTTATFAIIAQDSCGNALPWNNDYLIRTLNLHTPLYNICNDECEISWDSIYQWQDLAMEGVRIYRRKGNEPFEVVASVSAEETSAFVYGFERNVKYEFYIEAYSSNDERTATSCIKRIWGRKPTQTKYTWLRSASIIEGEVHLKWQVDSLAYIPQYAISHSEDGLNYEIIDTAMGSRDTIQFYIDNKSKYYQGPQFYEITPFDSCLNLGEASNFAKTIYTRVESHSDGKALIEWTPYEQLGFLEYYNVYRVIDSLIYPFPVGEVYPDEELSYVDDYSLSAPLLSKVGYIVEAVGRFIDTLPAQDTARSNTNFLAKVSNLFVPSGFRPQGGVTTVFKPIYTGVKLRNYSFKVLTRWGQTIFESNQPVLGWDGTYEKEYVMPGAYVYVVDYETIYGKKMQKSGVFFVL